MNWVDIIATTIFTTIAGATVAFVSLYLKEKMDRKKYFKSLYNEIKTNYYFLKLNESVFEDLGLVEGSPHFYNFNTLSYHNISISGELSLLKEELQEKIHNVYSWIDDFNKERNKEKIYLGDLAEFLKEFKSDMEDLIEELPEVLDFIKLRTTISTQKKY